MEVGKRIVVRIELLSLDDEVTYKYFPEQETENFGIVSVNRHTGERFIKVKAKGYGSEYAFHACREIERYIKKGEFKPKGVVAWY